MKCTATKTNQSSESSAKYQTNNASLVSDYQRNCKQRSSTSRLLASPTSTVILLIMLSCAFTLSVIGSDTTFASSNSLNGASFINRTTNRYQLNNSFRTPSLNSGIMGSTTDFNADSVNNINNSKSDLMDVAVKLGSHTNTHVVRLVSNSIPYSIIYKENVVGGMPGNIISGMADSSSVNLSDLIPKRNGYTFKGWCDAVPATTGDSDTCSGTTYNPNGSGTDLIYTLINESANDLTLYAIWQRNTMQNVSEWQDSLGIGEETTAVDTRDGNVYSVARLCMSAATHTLPTLNTCDRTMLWMTQNLDLSVGPTGSQVLTSADSDINQDLGTEQGYSTNGTTITWTPNADTMNSPKYITNHATGSRENSTNWVNDNSLPYWAEGGDYYVYTSGNNDTDSIYGTLTACINANHTESECRHYHVGNYYNWSAAVATNASSSYTDDLYVMPNSICPKGWRLPNGLTGTNGNEIITEFNQLGLANNITADITTAHNTGSSIGVSTGWTPTGFNSFRSTSTNPAGKAAPMYFTRSGYLYGTTLYFYGANGLLWSNTSQSTSITYYLEFTSDVFDPATQRGRIYGFPVRCVAR